MPRPKLKVRESSVASEIVLEVFSKNGSYAQEIAESLGKSPSNVIPQLKKAVDEGYFTTEQSPNFNRKLYKPRIDILVEQLVDMLCEEDVLFAYAFGSKDKEEVHDNLKDQVASQVDFESLKGYILWSRIFIALTPKPEYAQEGTIDKVVNIFKYEDGDQAEDKDKHLPPPAFSARHASLALGYLLRKQWKDVKSCMSLYNVLTWFIVQNREIQRYTETGEFTLETSFKSLFTAVDLSFYRKIRTEEELDILSRSILLLLALRNLNDERLYYQYRETHDDIEEESTYIREVLDSSVRE